ncbi:uncharacterized protein LOC108845988 isoform X1 [Raphanus sativus]|uniref:Non-structural maintenance of chromosomes element 1 homolog n=1 Tax=Raphanus sativus TaxID=3726 RepID=A0A9W3D9Y0_RAPSA|nr:uncharacterized protein LOC108845988 isoform X1 [Raphanus sativus]
MSPMINPNSGLNILFLRLPSLKRFIVTSEASSSQQQVPPAFKNFSMSQKDITLDELVKDNWLCPTRDCNTGLTIKSLLDLRSCFRDYEVPSSEVCNEAGVKDDRVCSRCGKSWPLGRVTTYHSSE